MSIYSYIYIFICFYTFKPFEFVICIISTWRERKPETVTKSMCVLFWFLLYISFCVVLQRDLYDAGVHDHVNFCNIESAMKQLCIMCVFFPYWFLLLLLLIFFYDSRKNMFTFREFDNFYICCKCKQTAHNKTTRKKKPVEHLAILHAYIPESKRRRIKKTHPNTSSFCMQNELRLLYTFMLLCGSWVDVEVNREFV